MQTKQSHQQCFKVLDKGLKILLQPLLLLLRSYAHACM